MSAGPASPTQGGHQGRGRGPGKLAGRGHMQHGRPAPESNYQGMEDVSAPTNVYGHPVKRLHKPSKNEGGRVGPKREPEVDVHPLTPRVAQERPSRGPHRAVAEGVADVRFCQKRVPPQAAHNGHGRIHGGIPYRKLLGKCPK